VLPDTKEIALADGQGNFFVGFRAETLNFGATGGD
jgi:hypothetical protein